MSRHHSDRWRETETRGPYRPRRRGRAAHRAWRKHQKTLRDLRDQQRHRAAERMHACGRKVAYALLDRAKGAADQRSRPGVTMYVYQCRYCAKYHLTKRKEDSLYGGRAQS